MSTNDAGLAVGIILIIGAPGIAAAFVAIENKVRRRP